MFKISENDRNMLINILNQVYTLNVYSPALFDREIRPLIDRLLNASNVAEELQQEPQE